MSTAFGSDAYWNKKIEVLDWMDKVFGEEDIEYQKVMDYFSGGMEQWIHDDRIPSCIWSDGDMIMVRDEDVCEFMADWIEVHCLIDGEPLDNSSTVGTMYYDPYEDEKDDCVDEYTGWYCIDII